MTRLPTTSSFDPFRHRRSARPFPVARRLAGVDSRFAACASPQKCRCRPSPLLHRRRPRDEGRRGGGGRHRQASPRWDRRILTTLLLLQAGYTYVPYSSLESVIENSKEAYYLALRQTQGTIRTDTPNWQPWILFFLQALAQQKRRLAAKVEREKITLATLPELAAQIIEQARQHGRVTIGEMAKVTGASRNTLKVHFRRLVEQGHLTRYGTGKGSWYALP